MSPLDRRGLALLAAGLGLGVANVVLALLGQAMEVWRLGLAGALMVAGLVLLAVGVHRD